MRATLYAIELHSSAFVIATVMNTAIPFFEHYSLHISPLCYTYTIDMKYLITGCVTLFKQYPRYYGKIYGPCLATSSCDSTR